MPWSCRRAQGHGWKSFGVVRRRLTSVVSERENNHVDHHHHRHFVCCFVVGRITVVIISLTHIAGRCVLNTRVCLTVLVDLAGDNNTHAHTLMPK